MAPISHHIKGDGTITMGTVDRGKLTGFCRVGSQITVGNCAKLVATLNAWEEGEIAIGDRTTINGARIDAMASKVMIGEDCMFSDEIIIQGYDQHTIVDIPTRSPVNHEKRGVAIGNHVWIGRRAIILPGVTIGHGAIIGAGSVVTRNVPPQTAFAGNPAAQIRNHVTWSRSASRIGGDYPRYIRSLTKDPDQ